MSNELNVMSGVTCLNAIDANGIPIGCIACATPEEGDGTSKVRVMA